MGKMIRVLNIAAFCCSVAACVLILGVALGWAGEASVAVNRSISSLVAGYACCYGLSQWLQKGNRTLAIGLMVIGTLILAANMAFPR